jgi:general nucleoside transport system permease protein
VTQLLVSSEVWALTLQDATALAFCVFGLYLPLRAGVMNVGAEGVMLISCFGAVLGEADSGDVWVGVICGCLAGALVSSVFAALTVTLRADPFVLGIALNFIALGGTSVAAAAMYGISGTISVPDLAALPTWGPPLLGRVPWVDQALGGQTPLFYLAVLIAIALAWWLASTRGGLTVRAAGPRPDVVEARGRSVAAVRWATLVVGGMLIGLGGAQLALASAPQFTYDMTSGRGFIALALVLIVGARAWLLFPLAVAFAFFDGLGANLQTVGLPSELSDVLPYAAVVVLLVLPRTRQWVTRGSIQSDVDEPGGNAGAEGLSLVYGEGLSSSPSPA